jgi:hypothetical protein
MIELPTVDGVSTSMGTSVSTPASSTTILRRTSSVTCQAPASICCAVARSVSSSQYVFFSKRSGLRMVEDPQDAVTFDTLRGRELPEGANRGRRADDGLRREFECREEFLARNNKIPSVSY